MLPCEWRRVSALLALLHFACAEAQSAPPTPAEPWPNLGLLYRSDTNPYVQEVWALGRYHGQYWDSAGSAGADDGYENRRFRIGGQARLFNNLTLHAQMVSGNAFSATPLEQQATSRQGWRFAGDDKPR